MKKYLRALIVFVIALVVICPTLALAESDEYHHVYPQAIFGSQGHDYTVKISYFDHKFVHSSSSRFNTSWNNYKVFHEDYYGANEPYTVEQSKLQAAFAAGTGILEYWAFSRGFGTSYDKREINFLASPIFHFDAVSWFFYNVSYLCWAPIKFCTGIYFAITHGYGLVGIIQVIWYLAYGCVLAFCAIFLSFIPLTCHPIGTLQNLCFCIFIPFWELFQGVKALLQFVVGIVGLFILAAIFFH